jgi:CO/xanthine dehydrogenase Mo-binding subunit
LTDHDVVGKKTNAVGGSDIVTGKARYCADLNLPGTLVGKLLYSKHACARIVKLDISKARALPGVVAVLTYEDIPGENSYLFWEDDQPLLASDYVRCKGDILAVVAAEDEDSARAALDAIEVEYEPLPGIFDPVEAMKPDAPRVWPDRNNIHSQLVTEHGDVEAGFEQADVIVENTYTTQRVEHAFIETENALAYVDEDGTLVVYASSQAPHSDRQQIARSLAFPESQVRVIIPYVGGAFGGKIEATVQIHAALLAYKTGRPVRVQRTREESIDTHVKRHPMIIHYRTGATRDGLLTAVEYEVIGDTGPYVNAGESVLSVSGMYGFGPYYIPNARSTAFTVLTNNPCAGAFRGFGAPQVNFAYEQQMDELARKLNLDPMEIRLRNGIKTGDQIPMGFRVLDGRGMEATLDEAVKLSSWNDRHDFERQPEPYLRRGWGVGCTMYTTGYGPNAGDHAGASLDMAADGSVLLRTGAVDMGQGIHTVLAQYAAEGLGVELSAIKVIRPDTQVTPDAGPSVASRSTFVSGHAVIKACEPIRQSLLEVAAQETGLDKDLLTLHKGHLYADDEELHLTAPDLAAKAHQQGRQMHAEGFYVVEYPGDFPKDEDPNTTEPYNFAAHVARVLVDVETGEVLVEDYVAVHESGTIINPDGGAGQITGGVAQGLGYSLMEDLLVDQGRIQNTSLESYLIPTAMDVPKIKVATVAFPYTYGPLGAKGLGEPPIIPVAAAVANAVADAIGARVVHLPMTPEGVLEAIDTHTKEMGD